MSTKIVLFDIGNVLMLADHRRTIETYIVRYGVPRDKAEGYFERPDYRQAGKGIVGWFEYCQRLGDEWIFFLANCCITEIHSSHIYAVDHDVLGIIDRLMKRLPVGFVTDTCYPEWSRYVELEPRFESDFIAWRSDEEGHYKADPRAFDSIVKDWIPRNFNLFADPGEILLIDDSLANCQAAAAIGIQTFKYIERQPWLLEERLINLNLLF